MAKTIVGLFNDKNDAERAVKELASAGFPRTDIDMIARNGAPTADLDAVENLIRVGVPGEDAREYTSHLASGKALVLVKAPEAAAQRAVTVMERNAVRDVDQGSARRVEGAAVSQEPGVAPVQTTATIPRDENERTLAREDVARARDIEEHKVVEPNPVHFTPEANPFRDSSGGDAGVTPEHEYAHRYGQTLASDSRHRGKDWEAVEPEVRREWSTHKKGAWEEFKEMVRNAWHRKSNE